MKPKFLSRYFSIIFIIATLMGVFHHHDDLKQHSDCQICTIQNTIANSDIPVEVIYLTKLENLSESIISIPTNLHIKKIQNPLNARAPPKIS